MMEPTRRRCCSTAANALRDMGRLDEALAAYGRVLQVEPISLAA
jgi:hypothetical protein